MLTETLTTAFRKARSVNQTSNGYVSKIPTATEPSGDAGTATGASIIELGNNGGTGQNLVIICPYGLHASVDNKTMSMRVIGWREAGVDNQATKLWIPVPLVEVACTLTGTAIGVAGKALIATEGFADTIALTGTTANDDVSVDIVSPANDTIGHLVVDVKGFQKLELSFTTGGSATSCNALVALY